MQEPAPLYLTQLLLTRRQQTIQCHCSGWHLGKNKLYSYGNPVNRYCYSISSGCRQPPKKTRFCLISGTGKYDSIVSRLFNKNTRNVSKRDTECCCSSFIGAIGKTSNI